MTYLPKIIPVAYGATDFGFLSFTPLLNREASLIVLRMCVYVTSSLYAQLFLQLCLPLAHSTEGRDRGVYLFLVLNPPLAALRGINMSMFSVFTD